MKVSNKSLTPSSAADLTRSPPTTLFPGAYNAAADLLGRNLQEGRAEKTAFIDDAGAYSYGTLAQRVSVFANALRREGVASGQRILLCIHDGVDFPVTFLGAIQAGVVPVPVNTLLTPSDYAYLLEDSGAVLAIVSAPLRQNFEPLLATASALRRLIVSGATPTDAESLHAFCAGASEANTFAATRSNDICFWLYSSGSTGPPKGTVHIHSSLILTANLYAVPILGISQCDVVFSAAKLFFAYGLGNALTFPLAVGATAVLMAARATPAAVVQRLQSHSATIFCGVPTLYAALLASPDLPDGSAFALRRCTSAGEPLPEEIGKRWRARMGVDILDGIGSTEMLHIFLSNFPGDVRYGTTGKPVPGYRLRLVDDGGNEVAPGQQGELQIAGPSSAAMYWNNAEKTRDTFLGEWTRSGDKYSQTPDGYYVYGGRNDDMLKVSGIYVSPSEVESALVSHESVLEAAVVGREDKDGLVKPMAYVVIKPGKVVDQVLSGALQQHVKSRLAPYKYPRWIEFCDDLPKTATGKIQRFKLRKRATQIAEPASTDSSAHRATLNGRSLEYQCISGGALNAPTLVFLHEGLGSITLWKDFPRRLAIASGCDALVYSRYGNGFSDILTEARRPDYMHREALETLPALLNHLSIRTFILVGHSDGASIALLHGGFGSRAAAGLIVCAPHLFVEEITVRSIQAAKIAYVSTDLRAKLERHHADVNRTFWGWNDIWLRDDFRQWNIEDCVPEIRCPILAVQGVDDEYGTMNQIDRISELNVRAQPCKLTTCGHSAHRDQPETLLGAAVDFIRKL